MTGTLVARERLSPETAAAMLRLLQENFRNVTREQFERDLAEKNWVIVLRDAAEKLVGFSTFLMYETVFEEKRLAIIYSGDTIVSHEAWGSPALPRTWIQSVWQVHGERFAGLPLYWLLITSGYRTYRFLSVFWREFYPSVGRETPGRMQRLLEHVARERFGESFDVAKGVVHLGQPLREELLTMPEGPRPDPHIAFFAQRNPGYVMGDELACIAPLTRENLTAAGWRMVKPPGNATAGGR